MPASRMEGTCGRLTTRSRSNRRIATTAMLELIMNHSGIGDSLAARPPAARVEDRTSMGAFRGDGAVAVSKVCPTLYPLAVAACAPCPDPRRSRGDDHRWTGYSLSPAHQYKHAGATAGLIDRRRARPRGCSGVAGLLHLPQLLFEVGELIAQARGEFELQFGGGRMHLGGQRFDELGEIGRRRAQRAGLVRGFALFVAQRRVVAALALAVVEFGQQLARVLVFALQPLGDVGDP